MFNFCECPASLYLQQVQDKKNKAHFFVVKFVFFPFVGLSNSAGSFSSPSLSGPSKSAKSTTRPFCCRNSDNDEADDDDEYDAGDDDDDVESRRGDRSPQPGLVLISRTRKRIVFFRCRKAVLGSGSVRIHILLPDLEYFFILIRIRMDSHKILMFPNYGFFHSYIV